MDSIFNIFIMAFDRIHSSISNCSSKKVNEMIGESFLKLIFGYLVLIDVIKIIKSERTIKAIGFPVA